MIFVDDPICALYTLFISHNFFFFCHFHGWGGALRAWREDDFEQRPHNVHACIRQVDKPRNKHFLFYDSKVLWAVFVFVFVAVFFFFFFFYSYTWWHMEVPGLGVESELQLQVYT